MSTSGRMAKKTELNRKWEESLKQYKEPLLYARSVIVWKRPIDLGVLLVLIGVALWYLLTTKTTLVSIVSLGVVAWVVLDYVFTRAALTIPWQALVPLEQQSSVDQHFGEAVAFLVHIRFALSDAFDELQRFRAANPTRFLVQIAVSGLLLAYLGSFVSGYTLLVLTIYTLILLPGALVNGVPAQVAKVAGPHVKVYLDKGLVLYNNTMKQINQQVGKTTGGASTTTPSKPSHTASTPAAAPKDEDAATTAATKKED